MLTKGELRYTIVTTDGRQDRRLATSYEAQEEAANELREMMGWDNLVLSERYTVDEGSAVSAYPSYAACDSDPNGAHAPRIVRS